LITSLAQQRAQWGMAGLVGEVVGIA
jgi:hypothetical protein